MMSSLFVPVEFAQQGFKLPDSLENDPAAIWTAVYGTPVISDCAIRVSSPDRFEFRAVDSMVNPYLMQGALLKAIDDGLRNKIDPGEPEERNFAEVMASGEAIDRIPNTLEKALDALAENDVVKAALPGELYAIYDWYKRDEWNKFIWQVSNWDVDTYLDCLP